MDPAEVNLCNELYQRHLRLLKLHGKSQKTIEAYSRSVHRVSQHFHFFAPFEAVIFSLKFFFLLCHFCCSYYPTRLKPYRLCIFFISFIRRFSPTTPNRH